MSTDPEIAQHLDLSTRSVRELRSQGVLPSAGSDLDANRVACFRHLRARPERRGGSREPSELEVQRARAMRENADRAAMLNAEKRGETVEVASIRSAMIGQVEIMKSKLARVPARIAPADAVLKTRIASAIEDCLIDLSAERAIEAGQAHGSKRR